MQTSLIIPGRSTMLWLHVFNSGKQEIVAWGFSNSTAAVWVYYIYEFYESSLLQLQTYSMLVTRTGNAWAIQWGPGNKQAGLTASAAVFFRLVWMLFVFSVLLLLVFAHELEWIQMSFPPAQGFFVHNPWRFFGHTWQKYQYYIYCCALVVLSYLDGS